MPYLTNFYGWEFHVGTEEAQGRWIGVVRVVGDEGAPETRVRCQAARDTEVDAMNDAKLLAEDWSDRLERSPQSSRFTAERSLMRGGDETEPGTHYR
ncbi:MAG: hypothetical protein PGN26_10195 [Xylophilus ampelinus]